MSSERLPHAVLDLASRRHKGLKIARIAGIEHPDKPLRMLEVGTGSGGIAHWFGTHPSSRFDVDAVDVVDSRQTQDGYRFTLVPGTRLPFADESFDVVLSNHVVEHVGPPDAQLEHVTELHRVLRGDGIGYFAVPNRWMLVEPHFRLAFLSWLPEMLRSPYLRLMRRGAEYDCRPLSRPAANRLLAAAGFAYRQHCGDAVRLTYEIERPGALSYRMFRHVPEAVWRSLEPACPTLIYTLRKKTDGPFPA